MIAQKTGLKLSLLRNGAEFIETGIGAFFLEDAADAKARRYAVLHVLAGVLLLLQERLRKEHASLIFKDRARAGEPQAGTIDFDEAVSRLKSCAKVSFGEREAKLLRTAQVLRNRLELYEFEIELQTAKEILGCLAEFTETFARERLSAELATLLSPAVGRRLRELREIARRLEQERHHEWLRRAAAYRALDETKLVGIRQALEPFHPEHNPDPVEPEWCNSCGSETLVRAEHDLAVCTNPACRNLLHVSECLRCYSPIVGGGLWCAGCNEPASSELS